MESAILQWLNIEIVSASQKRAAAQMVLPSHAVDADGSVFEGMIASLAQAANHAGIAESKPVDRRPRPIDSKTNYFANGDGNLLYADARQIHTDGDIAIWRASIFRNANGRADKKRTLIAEMSQTFRWIPLSEADARAASAASPKVKKTSRPRSSQANTDKSAPSKVMAQRRRQIFEGACEVIARKGYGLATIREIARAANISIPTMYQYIDSKEDILLMITSECMHEIFESFKEGQRRGGSAVHKMEDAISNYLKYVSKNRKYINLVYRETKSLDEEGREEIFRIERKFCALWEKIIKDGNQSGEFKIADTELAANLIYFFCNVWALRYWNIGKYKEDKVRQMLNRFILAGLTARSPAKAKT